MKTIEQRIWEYDRETGMCSFQHMMRNASQYKEIIEIGEPAVPNILKYLRDTEQAGMSVMLLLWDILKTSPYQPIVEGGFSKFNVLEAKNAWIKWGVEHGHLEGKENDKNKI